MKTHALLFSIVIPSYRDWDRLKLCLAALDKQKFSKDLFEIIIVNNEIDSSPPDDLLLSSNCKMIHEPMPGSYAARNSGIKASKGSVIAFTDSDCIPDDCWLLNASKVLLEHKYEYLRITGPVNIFRGPSASWLAWKYDAITAFNQIYNVKNGLAVTANLFVTRNIFEKFGYFDSELMSGGDISWNRTITAHQIKILYAPNVIINHPSRLSLHQVIQKARRVIGGLFVLSKRRSIQSQLALALRQLIPPVHFAGVLLQNNKNIIDTTFAFFVYWLIKLIIFFEVVRLFLGGKALRE